MDTKNGGGETQGRVYEYLGVYARVDDMHGRFSKVHCSRFSRRQFLARRSRSHARGIEGKRKEVAGPTRGDRGEGRVGIVAGFCPCRNKRSRKSFEPGATRKEPGPFCAGLPPFRFYLRSSYLEQGSSVSN